MVRFPTTCTLHRVFPQSVANNSQARDCRNLPPQCAANRNCVHVHTLNDRLREERAASMPIDSPINKAVSESTQYISFVDRRIYWRFSPRVLRGADQFKVCTDTQSRFAAHFHQRMVADSGSHAPGCHLTTLCGNTLCKVHSVGNRTFDLVRT